MINLLEAFSLFINQRCCREEWKQHLLPKDEIYYLFCTLKFIYRLEQNKAYLIRKYALWSFSEFTRMPRVRSDGWLQKPLVINFIHKRRLLIDFFSLMTKITSAKSTRPVVNERAKILFSPVFNLTDNF